MNAPAETPDRCGTYAGYMAHRWRRDTPCRPCKDANRDYMAALRATNPDVMKQQKRQEMIRNRTLARLADLYPGEYQRIYAEVVEELHASERVAT